MKPECVSCGDEFNPRRFALGYYVCLECGDEEATKQILKKSKCTAPAYNKGAYMYVSSARMAKELGK